MSSSRRLLAEVQWLMVSFTLSSETEAARSISRASAVSLMLAMSMLVTSRMRLACSRVVAMISLKVPGVSMMT
jgi:hypothetical protein